MEQQAAGLSRTARDVSHAVVTAALKVHSALGPGLLENAYEACLMHELHKTSLKVSSQIALPLEYDGIKLDIGYRLDLVAEDLVIVEIKAVEAITNIQQATGTLIHEAEWQVVRPDYQFQRPAPPRRY